VTCTCTPVVEVGGTRWAYERGLGWHDPDRPHPLPAPADLS